MAKGRRIAWLGWASLTALAMLVGCSGDQGPAGPAGPAGAEGTPGRDGEGSAGEPSVSAVSPGVAFLDRRIEVRIAGNGTAWDAGSPPAINFGDGITVNEVTVASRTSLTAIITVGADAELGKRDVTVGEGETATTYLGSFDVQAPLDVLGILGTPAQGSVMIVQAEQLDKSTPFNPFMPIFEVRAGEGSGYAPAEGEFTDYNLSALLFLDVNAATGPTDVLVDNGFDGAMVTSRSPAVFETAAREPIAVTEAAPGTATIANVLDSALFTYTFPADTDITLQVTASDGVSEPAFLLVPSSGKIAEYVAYGPDVEIPAGTFDGEQFYLVVVDLGGGAGYDVTVSAKPPAPPPPADANEPNNTEAEATTVAVGSTTEATIAPPLDSDYYQVVTGITGGTLTATVVDGTNFTCDAQQNPSIVIDSQIEILDVNGAPLPNEESFSDDIGLANWCSEAWTNATPLTTYYVVVRASQQYCMGCQFDYGVSITVN